MVPLRPLYVGAEYHHIPGRDNAAPLRGRIGCGKANAVLTLGKLVLYSPKLLCPDWISRENRHMEH